ncbi:MAG: NADH-quinone oxidoreductase subunit J [Bacteroidales bacterium]|nr:NADH-quinone oxidoreductase subunit J [Bacteroidales bacterium]
MELTFNQIMFIIISGVIILFSVLTVTSKRILRAATFLLFVLVATAGLYFMLNYQFLAAVQLTLYAGGIVVLIIFSILLTSHISQKFEEVSISKKIFAALAVILGMVLCIITILQYEYSATTIAAEELNMKIIGRSLLGYGREGYALPFEVISVLLLAAMVGAIVVAKKVKK